MNINNHNNLISANSYENDYYKYLQNQYRKFV